jgi:hypothetical protein
VTQRYTTLMSRHEKRYVYDRMVNNGRKDYYGGIAEEGSLDGAAGGKRAWMRLGVGHRRCFYTLALFRGPLKCTLTEWVVLSFVKLFL